MIDEAQNLSLPALEEIRMLSNLETEKSKLIQIIMIGQPELREKLRAAAAASSCASASPSAITCSRSMPTRRRHYVNHRLRRAAIGPAVEFPRDVTDLIHTRSRGVPRIINVIADATLLFAYGVDRRDVDVGIAEEALAELDATGVLASYHSEGADAAAPPRLSMAETEEALRLADEMSGSASRRWSPRERELAQREQADRGAAAAWSRKRPGLLALGRGARRRANEPSRRRRCGDAQTPARHASSRCGGPAVGARVGNASRAASLPAVDRSAAGCAGGQPGAPGVRSGDDRKQPRRDASGHGAAAADAPAMRSGVAPTSKASATEASVAQRRAGAALSPHARSAPGTAPGSGSASGACCSASPNLKQEPETSHEPLPPPPCSQEIENRDRPAPASSVSVTSACRWRSSSPAPG